MTTVSETELDEFTERAREWLAETVPPRAPDDHRSVAVFHDLPFAEEQALLGRIREWLRTKFDAGYGSALLAGGPGRRGSSALHDEAFAEVEREFSTPGQHELTSVSTALVAPTVQLFGTPHQTGALARPLLRGDITACQLFSEPAAGSDLAGLATRAVRDGDGWVVTGQKVWSSGAQFADSGELICRTDPDVPKHRGLTAFLLRMDTPGVDVRPLRQMSGGTSFCEVFLDEVRIPDAWRLGEVGGGWGVTLATLGFERGHSGANADLGGGYDQLLDDARRLGRTADPEVRRLLAAVYAAEKVAAVSAQRDREARLAGGVTARSGRSASWPGPSGSPWSRGPLRPSSGRG